MTLPKTQHNTTTSNLQARARAARYRLLTQWCHAHDVSDLLLAHHLDDQAETFLMRLARGSGVDGLSCMQACTERDGIRLLRPLLNVRKTTLVDYLTQRNQRWLEDPSNHNPAFSRTHIRTWLAQQEAPGISAGNLAVTGARMQRARDALEHYTVDALTRHARIYEEGCATLNPQALRTLPEEIGLRLLSHLLCVVGGQHYRHRFEQLEAVFSAVKTEAPFTTRTFGGCLLKRHDQRLWILREVSACAAPSALLSGQEMHWDRRYRIQIASAMHLKNTLQIAPLSAAGWHVARRASRCNSTRSIPREAFYALPAVMRDEEPIAIPHMGWYADPRMKGHIIVRFSPPKLLPGHRYHVLMGGN